MIKNWTVLDIIDWAVPYLTKKNIENPRLQIEILICEVLCLSRIDIYLHYDRPFNKEELSSIKKYIERIVNHEPIQYVLGYTEFFNSKISVNSNVLIPRPETELLVEATISEFSKIESPVDALDIGTGSGCIPISLAKELPEINFYGIDYFTEAIKIAKENSIKNGVNVKFKRMDILNEVPQKKFSAVLSNPPYIAIQKHKTLDKNVLEYEPASALTDNNDGLTFYRRFAEIFPNIIEPNGFFAIEIGYGQSKQIRQLFDNQFDIQIIKDYSNIDRILIGKFKNS